MKNYTSIILKSTLIVVTVFSTNSCMNTSAEETLAIKEYNTEEKFENNNPNDAQFLVHAAELNRKGILLGQLAQEKGSSKDVRELGEMMKVEHQISLDDLKVLAKIKNILLPTSQTTNGQEAYLKLNEKSGKAFGKEFSNMMVKEHIEAIALFEKVSIECDDLDIRAWAITTLPVLRKHLEHSIRCQEICAKM